MYVAIVIVSNTNKLYRRYHKGTSPSTRITISENKHKDYKQGKYLTSDRQKENIVATVYQRRSRLAIVRPIATMKKIVPRMPNHQARLSVS